MSEEILKALMQLFAIIVKQDVGLADKELDYVKKFLRQQLNEDAAKEYLDMFVDLVGDTISTRVAVNLSVKVLGLCRKINKTLNQGQKVVALVRLFELLNSNRQFTDKRMEIIHTVADVFNITKDEFKSIESFVIQNEPEKLDNPHILIINDKDSDYQFSKKIKSEELDGNIYILQIKSSELYFLKYTGNQSTYLNGLTVDNRRVYLFAPGSSLKLPKGRPVYYSDVISHYLSDVTLKRLSLNVNNISYRFKTGNLGIRNLSFSETHGKLIGIMGASGSGKTTLLNVLAGIETPSEGSVVINGLDLHKEKHKLEGVLGYIPQDDLLIEELTVFQNLYFCAKQCFKDKTEEEKIEVVNKTLKNLGLYDRKDLKVGSPLNKMISGGQRKRLNIALELIREPSILFVDEPTSGLSSRDSQNVMDLLSELALKGKLIFVVIHQPSSDIYKMFDKMILLDTGGYMVYYGNPVEAVMYFKKIDNQINADAGDCPVCGNITPELIFNILEAQVVDEFGQYTDKRKILPPRWEELYRENLSFQKTEDVTEEPPRSLSIPSWFAQLKIYSLRDFLSKISNTQYVVLTLVEAPLLAFMLSFIIHYIADPHSSVYIFYDNENVPPYIFMSIVVSLFLGLTVSAEEIFRDRKILKREQFLNLSRSSYLTSKVFILFVISALQSLLFVIIGNSILGVKGMMFEYWYVMFATSAFANMLGLNISATFNSAVTIYILIPLLMIPQMALGGAMFSFDKLNRTIGSVDKVPLIAEFMASRWAYEALIIHQFKDNKFETAFFEIDKRESNADFKVSHYIPNLSDRVDNISKRLGMMTEGDTSEVSSTVDFQENLTNSRKSKVQLSEEDLNSVQIDIALLKRELEKEDINIKKLTLNLSDRITIANFRNETADELRTLIEIARTPINVKIGDKESDTEEQTTDSIPASVDSTNVKKQSDESSVNKDNVTTDEENNSGNANSPDTSLNERMEDMTNENSENSEPDKEKEAVAYSFRELELMMVECAKRLKEKPNKEDLEEIKENLDSLQIEVERSTKSLSAINFSIRKRLDIDSINVETVVYLKAYLQKIKSYHSKIFQLANNKRQLIVNKRNEKNPGMHLALMRAYHNEATSDYVKKVLEKNKILRYKDQLIQQIDPIFLDPIPYHFFDFRAHFYAPRKHFMGHYFETFWFNIIIIWIMTAFLYVTLYYEHLKKVIDWTGATNILVVKKINKLNIKRFFPKINRPKNKTTEKEREVEKEKEKNAERAEKKRDREKLRERDVESEQSNEELKDQEKLKDKERIREKRERFREKNKEENEQQNELDSETLKDTDKDPENI